MTVFARGKSAVVSSAVRPAPGTIGSRPSTVPVEPDGSMTTANSSPSPVTSHGRSR